MPQTFAQRVTLILPLVGVALLLAAMILPFQSAVFFWGLAMVSFLAALACAILALREDPAARPSPAASVLISDDFTKGMR